MKAVMVVGVVVALHVVAAALVFVSPGCRSPEADMPERRVAPMPDPVTVTPVPDMREPRRPMRPPVAPRPLDPQPPAVAIETKEYTVQSGDVLSRIAARTGVSVTEIMELNDLRDADRIYEGQTLLLPPHAQLDAPTARPPDERAAPARIPEDGIMHEVRPGEALSVIAQQYGVSVRAIVEANNLRDANTIRAGQELLIPGADRPAPTLREPRPARPERDQPPEPRPEIRTETPEAPQDDPFTEREHRVRDAAVPEADEEWSALIQRSGGDMVHVVDQGQTLDDIAGMYGRRVEELQRYNNLDSRHVTTGQTLKIPRD